MNDKKKTKELFFYIVFGVLTTIVSWTSYTLFINVFDFSVAFSNILSWILSVIFAYVTNKVWVFNSKSWKIKILIKEISTFVSSRFLTGIIEMLGVPLLAKIGFDNVFYTLLKNLNISTELLFTEGIYSKVIFAVVVVILNYIFSKLIVFKRKNGGINNEC